MEVYKNLPGSRRAAPFFFFANKFRGNWRSLRNTVEYHTPISKKQPVKKRLAIKRNKTGQKPGARKLALKKLAQKTKKGNALPLIRTYAPLTHSLQAMASADSSLESAITF